MAKKNAIMFNGAASLIAQEAGMLDLLMEMKGVTINQDQTFLAGLSSGALMTTITNAAFSDSPSISWSEFKETILFPLRTRQIYKGLVPTFDTQPLRDLLTRVVQDRAGYQVLGDLPFQSAILTASEMTQTTYWLNNTVTDTIPPGSDAISEQIREHELQVRVVDSLMCSTAIPKITPKLPKIFPSQNLQYEDNGGETYVTTDNGEIAEFVDGGTYGSFIGFQEFFGAYDQTFDDMYVISPSLPGTKQEAAKLLGESLGHELDEVSQSFTRQPFKVFVNELKRYNDRKGMAKNIYLCRSGIRLFDPLKFSTERTQYDRTIRWGKAHPDKIAININDV